MSRSPFPDQLDCLENDLGEITKFGASHRTVEEVKMAIREEPGEDAGAGPTLDLLTKVVLAVYVVAL